MLCAIPQWNSAALERRGFMTSKKLSSSRLIAALAIVLAAATLVPAAFAQSAGTGALTGTVIDPTGAVVPGVSVTLVSLETNQTRTATTGNDGVYKFSLISPGNYSV